MLRNWGAGGVACGYRQGAKRKERDNMVCKYTWCPNFFPLTSHVLELSSSREQVFNAEGLEDWNGNQEAS